MGKNLSFCSRNTSGGGNDLDRDREALLGKFLLEEKSSNFSFESFKSRVVASLAKDDFKVKLDPDVFQLKDVSIKKFFFQIEGTQTLCFTDGTDVPLSKQDKK